MWDLDHKEGWVPKNWCFWTVVLEKTWESLGDLEIKPVNPKGNQPRIFIGRTDAEAKAPIFGHLKWRADSLEKTLLLVEGERDDRGWYGWMASLTRWTWVWANSVKPGVLQSMGLQRIGLGLATEQQRSVNANSHYLYHPPFKAFSDTGCKVVVLLIMFLV